MANGKRALEMTIAAIVPAIVLVAVFVAIVWFVLNMPDADDVRDIAAAVAIDVEGEHPDCLERASLELIDITLRTKQRLPAMTYQEIVGKALAWVPDDWDYPLQWQDRNATIVGMRRSKAVEKLTPIVFKRMTLGPGPGCAAKVVRAKFHLFGFAGGERRATNEISTYPKDPRFSDGKCKTDFRCLPLKE